MLSSWMQDCLAIVMACMLVFMMFKIQELQVEQAIVTLEVQKNGYSIQQLQRDPYVPIELTVTAYSPEESQTDSTPLTTAFMTKVRKGTIAVSEDLLNAGWVAGKKVYIRGLGIFVINDLMHVRKKQHIDIFMWKTPEALKISPSKKLVILLEI